MSNTNTDAIQPELVNQLDQASTGQGGIELEKRKYPEEDELRAGRVEIIQSQGMSSNEREPKVTPFSLLGRLDTIRIEDEGEEVDLNCYEDEHMLEGRYKKEVFSPIQERPGEEECSLEKSSTERAIKVKEGSQDQRRLFLRDGSLALKVYGRKYDYLRFV